MLVEDNPADAALVRRALELHGVEGEILVFSDGDKAIVYLQSLNDQSGQCPDLIIIDLNLPRKNGLEVLQHVRAHASCRTVTAAILSSSDAPQDKADAARLGASRYLRKPLHLEEFLALGAAFRELLAGGPR